MAYFSIHTVESPARSGKQHTPLCEHTVTLLTGGVLFSRMELHLEMSNGIQGPVREDQVCLLSESTLGWA